MAAPALRTSALLLTSSSLFCCHLDLRIAARATSCTLLSKRIYRSSFRHIRYSSENSTKMAAKVVRQPKKLIVACDGTWMNSDVGWSKGGWFDPGHPQNPSNVTRLVRALNPEDSEQRVQIAYYQSGIGTSWSPVDNILGGGLALGLSENVREAYGFLVNNYHGGPGGPDDPTNDKLFFIGFSRGAYTARSVAGMIGCLGLLTKSAMSHFYVVFEDFENAGQVDYKPQLPQYWPGFKIEVPSRDINSYLKAYRDELVRLNMTRIVNVQAIGVFDTVGSLGVPVTPLLQKLGLPTTLHSYRFFDTGIDDHVKNAFQVLALDEHRSAFGPTIWSKRDGSKTNLKQIWIPGVHTNAGGGADDNGMCDISLAWMMDQLSGPDLLEFDEQYIVKQVKKTQDDYRMRFDIPWQWGLGKLGNSMKFPTSLAGSVIREPLDYFVTDYDSGRRTNIRLSNTNELIHASVRLRYMKGKTYDGHQYVAQGLQQWKEPSAGINEPYWQHTVDATRRLYVDKIGTFEQMILDLDKEAKDFVENGPTLGDKHDEW